MTFMRIEDLLVCPRCYGELDFAPLELACRQPKCAAVYSMVQGIPCFTPASLHPRFEQAQLAESSHHVDAWTQLKVGELAGVRSFPEYIGWLESFYRSGLYAFGYPPTVFEGKTVLEVGSGPYGLLAALPHGTGLAIDPLMPSFVPYMATHWQPSPLRIAAMGEQLPIRDGTFDAAVTINCLDHTLQPQDILSELHRTLKPGGMLIIMNNVKSTAGRWLNQIGERMGISRFTEVFHPASLSVTGLPRACEQAGFRVTRSCLMTINEPAETMAQRSLQNRLRRRVENERAMWVLAFKDA